MKSLIFFSPFPAWWDDYEQIELKTCLFLKYFPKYLKNLTIYPPHGAVKSKVKRSKIIHEFQNVQFFVKGSDWTFFLSNKMKSIQNLSNSSQSTTQFSNKIQLFSGLQSIEINLSPNFSRPVNKKACKKMLALPKLKHLRIKIMPCGMHDFSIIENLNSLPIILSSLKTLAVHSQSIEDQDIKLIEVMKENQRFLRSLTSLSLGSLCSPSHHQAFQSLANSCPNLRHLSFEFSCRNISYMRAKPRRFSSHRFPTHAHCLRIIKTFPNLKSLDLKIADNLAFLLHFSIPSGVQSLSLNFEETLSQEIMLQFADTLPDTERDELQILKVFEENHTLIKFFNNFEQLENLETLKLTFSADSGPKDSIYQSYLSQYILKKLLFLKHLAFIVKKSHAGLNTADLSDSLQDCYLPQLLGSCSQTLETLKVATYEKMISFEGDLSALRNKFVNLKMIKFNGGYAEDNIKFIGFSLQQLISLGSSITTMRFTVYMKQSSESFLEIIEQLKKLQIPNQLQLLMKIKPIKCQNFEDLNFPSEELISRLEQDQEKLKRLQGISLTLLTNSNFKKFFKFLRTFGRVFDNFKVFHKPEIPYWTKFLIYSSYEQSLGT